MERIKKLLSLVEMCSDSEQEKNVVRETRHEAEERENGRIMESK